MRPNNGSIHDFCLPKVTFILQFLKHTKIQQSRTVVEPLLPIIEKQLQFVPFYWSDF